MCLGKVAGIVSAPSRVIGDRVDKKNREVARDESRRPELEGRPAPLIRSWNLTIEETYHESLAQVCEQSESSR